MNKLLTTTSIIVLGLVTSASAADLAGAKVASPVVAPAALPLFDAYLSLGAGYTFGKESGYGDEFDNKGARVQARATFAAQVFGNYGFQGDGVFGHDWAKYDTEYAYKNPTTETTLAAHGFWRDSKLGAVGLLVQYTNLDSPIKANGYSYPMQNDNYLVGLEGQYFLGNVTLYAQAAYHYADATYYYTNLDGDGFTLAGQIRYFATPNWQITLKGGYDDVSLDNSYNDVDVNVWNVGLRTDYRLANSPLSFFGEATYSDSKFDWSGSVSHDKETRVLVGFKYNLGTGTLLERDRSGASFDPLELHGRGAIFNN